MAGKIRLSVEDQAILHKLSIEQLRFLTQLDDHKDKERLVEILNLLISREKEVFFQENSLKLTPDKLWALHSYSRGTVTAYVTFFHLLRGAGIELMRREIVNKEIK